MPNQILSEPGIFQNRIALYIAAAVIVAAVFLLILIIFRRRKFRKIISVNFTGNAEGGNEQAKDNYESIVKRIKQVKKKYKSILFASAEQEALPVTIPVNTAIGLAKEKLRCLLIDLDLRRDAVAKVFGIDADQSGLSPRSVQTEFENLRIWPAHKFSQSKQMNIVDIVEKALDKKSPQKFDFTLINAPALVGNLDRKQVIAAAQAAFVCTKDTPEREKLDKLIKPSDCRIIGSIQIN